MSIAVAIVEDDDRVRGGLMALLDGTPGFACSGAWGTAESAIAELPARHPSVVLMDINLPGLNGIECARRLRELSPETLVLMLTVLENDDQIFEALKAGAHGYLTKQTPPAEILEGIKQVHAGGSPMSPNVARKVIRSFHDAGSPPPALPTPPPAALPHLSPRETEILERLAQGFLYKEIAPPLGISVETVRTHIRNIYEKLHVRTRTEAVLKVLGAPTRKLK
jgi:DNA-binding NarL/FixJ family response regulator